MLKINLLRDLQTSQVNSSTILRIKNAKFSVYRFYMNANIQGDFQICISVPLKTVRVKAMFTGIAFEILLFEGRSVLSPDQRGTKRERVKGQLHFETITSRNVPSEAQVKNFFVP